MTLNDRQHIFSQNLAKLLLHVETLGFTCSIGEVYRTSEQAKLYAQEGKGIVDSQHCKKLAVDLQLFSNGSFLQDKNEYEPLGIFWESLNPENRWGGRFPNRVDSVHFEMKG